MTREYFRIALDTSLAKEKVQLCLDYINYLESQNCGSCKYWVKYSDKHDLRRCQADNGCEITGPKFTCGNWEQVK